MPYLLRRILFIFFLFTTSSLCSQILEMNKPLFSDDPFFNTSFIRANKIKSITGSRSSKKVRDIIRKKGLDYQYRFHKNGLLKEQLATFYGLGNQKDTNITAYHYNSKGALISKRKNDQHGYYSYNYLLDALGNIIKETYCRDENKLTSKNEFQLAKQYIIKSDSFSYHQLNEQQIKKIFYNNYGKSYKEQFNYYNEYGYLIEEYTKFLIGNTKSKITYEYDEKGRIIKTENFSNLSENKKITNVYSYDEVGNVLEIKVYNNDKYITSQTIFIR